MDDILTILVVLLDERHTFVINYLPCFDKLFYVMDKLWAFLLMTGTMTNEAHAKQTNTSLQEEPGHSHQLVILKTINPVTLNIILTKGFCWCS